jgi:hypothetical protein
LDFRQSGRLFEENVARSGGQPGIAQRLQSQHGNDAGINPFEIRAELKLQILQWLVMVPMS